MKIHQIDNSLKNLGKAVLWQYDKAVRLLSILKHFQVMFHLAIEKFWNDWNTKVLAIDTCSDFGCALWGIILGKPRLVVENGDGTTRLIALSVYRKVLKSAFFWMKADASYSSLSEYIEILFGVSGEDALSPWEATVSEYGWTTNVDELNAEATLRETYFPRLAYRQGTIFHYEDGGTNWLCLEDIKKDENVSFEAILSLGKIQETDEPATPIAEPETLLLKLYDPEGVCRKIGGAPAGAVSISVEYTMGDMTITAQVRRGRKCGIRMVDNGDMSITYEKSEYFDKMHRDQQAIFEQKQDEYLPYPLGIKTNEPVGNWVFGVANDISPNKLQSNVQYSVGTEYKKDDIFGYLESPTNGKNWKCIEAISRVENTSFEAIKEKIAPTSEGGPFVDAIGGDGKPYLYIAPDAFFSEKVYNTPPTEVATIVPQQRLFVGLEDGFYKMFRNTTKGNLVVAWSMVEKNKAFQMMRIGNFVDIIGVEDPTIENLNLALAEIARKNNCPVVYFSKAKSFIPGVYYYVGDVVNFDNEPRVFTISGRWDDQSQALKNTTRQTMAGLHEFYQID